MNSTSSETFMYVFMTAISLVPAVVYLAVRIRGDRRSAARHAVAHARHR